MRAIYVVTCDFALMGAEGKPTLVGVFDSFRAPSVPFAWPRFALAARVEFELFEMVPHQLQIVIQDPSGARVGQAGGPVNLGALPPGVMKASFDPHMLFDNFVFAAFGAYTFSVEIDGINVGSTQVTVIQQSGVA